ncbi:unnamed protein product [Meganyctiphanes norvegica]|uniref:Uncharacterized protein n=1 Tax=Meganyctiphanes norvegica TaxID=48144 RepID=A0AAV2QEW1_MEGNR
MAVVLRLLLIVAAMFVMTSLGQQLLDPPPRQCRTLGTNIGSEEDVSDEVSVEAGATRNEYPAGGSMMVLALIPDGLTGVFEFYLCPLEPELGDQQEECLVKVPLVLGDRSGTQFDLSKVEKTDKYEIPIWLPEDLPSDNYTLMWRVVVTECDDDYSGETCVLKDDSFCTDVQIRDVKVREKRLFSMLISLASGIFGG